MLLVGVTLLVGCTSTESQVSSYSEGIISGGESLAQEEIEAVNQENIAIFESSDFSQENSDVQGTFEESESPLTLEDAPKGVWFNGNFLNSQVLEDNWQEFGFTKEVNGEYYRTVYQFEGTKISITKPGDHYPTGVSIKDPDREIELFTGVILNKTLLTEVPNYEKLYQERENTWFDGDLGIIYYSTDGIVTGVLFNE